MTNDDKDLKCPDYVESAFRKWFEYSPCFICGYKGGGYYQIKDHPCAEHYHNRTLSKLWDMDGNPIQHSLSGGSQQPSEHISLNTRPYNPVPSFAKGIKDAMNQPSEPLKELECKHEWVEQNLSDWCKLCGKIRPYVVNTNPFNKPSEKKVLSVEDMKKIMWDLENKLGYQPAYETIAQAIHSALPARKEVRWPEKREVNGLLANQMLSKKWNEAIDACIAAYEEAMPAQREVRYPEKNELRKIIQYHIEAYGGKINPKDDFNGFIYDIYQEMKKLNS